MGDFLSFYLQLILLSCAPPLLFGIGVWCCQRLFCGLTASPVARPLLIGGLALSTPVREAGHALGCMLFAHHIDEIRLLDIRAENGELGFVEHSYRPRNPIAQFGNLAFAVMPFALGLFAVFVIVSSCFYGAFQPFAVRVAELGEDGAGFTLYAEAVRGFLSELFRGAATGVILKIIGILLLLALCLGVYLSPEDLRDAFWGAVIYAALLFLFAAVCALLDERLRRAVLAAFRSFAAVVTALSLIVLLAAVAMVALAAAYALVAGLFASRNEER